MPISCTELIKEALKLEHYPLPFNQELSRLLLSHHKTVLHIHLMSKQRTTLHSRDRGWCALASSGTCLFTQPICSVLPHAAVAEIWNKSHQPCFYKHFVYIWNVFITQFQIKLCSPFREDVTSLRKNISTDVIFEQFTEIHIYLTQKIFLFDPYDWC